ncbi:unnamed protein product [Chondrus crispus]|uniref:lipoyl(octanoyl) transferase n=1 Tax=Chondrus crispus TaxID=2769 RepID=R7Q5U3_CHOCR|nr:unnamed protein product [Chondrus crispus]CDF32751.1 unnamed protein product [Chondrus crispus]|eukprot:XP_005712552.1 unnamed protein product [Chondrus crispus]
MQKSIDQSKRALALSSSSPDPHPPVRTALRFSASPSSLPPRPPPLPKAMTDTLTFTSTMPVQVLRPTRLLRRSPITSPLCKRRRLPALCRMSSARDLALEDPLPSATPLSQMHLYDLTRAPVPYQQAWELQHSLADARRRDAALPDALVLLEHEPVYTLGTASSLDHAAASTGSDVPLLVRTERGGEVTYHGPGQLVAYPILNLARHRKDLHWYLRSLEEVVVKMLKDGYGLEAGRKEGLTGVWVGGEKVCALGLKVSRWITMHGLAVNVDVDLGAFDRIVPCGVEGKAVTSLHKLGGHTSMDEAKRALVQSFCSVFGPYDVVAGDDGGGRDVTEALGDEARG